MRTLRGGFVLVLGLALGSGCSQRAAAPAAAAHEPALVSGVSRPDSGSLSPDPVLTTAAPWRGELPDFKATQRSIPAKIGVERFDFVPRRRIVADYSKVQLTEEEKKLLADEAAKKPKDDLLAFYRPQRGTEHGVSPLEGGMAVGSYGLGGAAVGLQFYPFPTFGVHSGAEQPIGIYGLSEFRYGTYGAAGRTTDLDPLGGVQIGKGLRRENSRALDIDEN